MAVLYRKYRPINFREIVNQNHIKTTLEHQIQTGQEAHAYLFCGPRGVGKTTMARVLAKAVNCQNRQADKADPCGHCQVCQEIGAGRSLDIIEIDAASNTGVDNVREAVIAAARVLPTLSRYKIFIIDEVHMLSVSAFNALLKVIEEPPPHVIFIFCTTEIHKVPLTIISRCQRFDFKRIGPAEVVKKLRYIIDQEGIKMEDSILEAIARWSDGHMRDAESLLGQVVAIGGKEISRAEADLVIPRNNLSASIDFLEALSRKDAAAALRLINQIMDEGVNLKQFVNDILEIGRKMLLGKVSPALIDKFGLEFGEQAELKIVSIAQAFDFGHLLTAINCLIKARQEIKDGFMIQLPLEMAAVEICLAGAVDKDLRSSARPTAANPASAEKSAPSEKVVKNNNQTDLRGNVFSLADINKRWSEVLGRVKNYNHSLSFILRVCQPKSLSEKNLCLGFKYKFHKERLGDPEIKNLVINVLKEVYNTDFNLEAVIDESIEVNNAVVPEGDKPAALPIDEKSDAAIDNLLKNFGGRVVG